MSLQVQQKFEATPITITGNNFHGDFSQNAIAGYGLNYTPDRTGYVFSVMMTIRIIWDSDTSVSYESQALNIIPVNIRLDLPFLNYAAKDSLGKLWQFWLNHPDYKRFNLPDGAYSEFTEKDESSIERVFDKFSTKNPTFKSLNI